MVVDTLIVYIKVIPSVADLHSFFLFIYLRVRSVHLRKGFIRDYFVRFNYCILAFFPHCGKNGHERPSEWPLSYSIHHCFLS